MSLSHFCREQRRLAYHAAPTALAINMHHYRVGVAADLWRSGDRSLEWLLEEAMSGEVFAAGHAESRNDIPVLLSTTRAEPVDCGYRFTGRKSLGSLGPAWTRLGLHGMDMTDSENPKVVHAFVSRDAEGLSTVRTWGDACSGCGRPAATTPSSTASSCPANRGTGRSSGPDLAIYVGTGCRRIRPSMRWRLARPDDRSSWARVW